MSAAHDTQALAACPCCGSTACELSDTSDHIAVSIGVWDHVICNASKGGCGMRSGYYDNAEEAVAAWNRRPALASRLKEQEGQPSTFPARILTVLHELADRKGTPTHGPAEDANGEPLQDDADAALAWIAARQEGQPALSDERPRKDWQKRAIEVGFEYWRSSDAQGVECKAAHAVSLLEELLGVEVEITNVAPPKCATCDDHGMIGGPSFYSPDEGGVPCPDCATLAPGSQVVQVPGWRPIETAPKNRTLLVGYHNALGKWRTVKASFYPAGTLMTEDDSTDCDEEGYAPEGWYEETETHECILRLERDPELWQPLPAAPLQPLAGGEVG